MLPASNGFYASSNLVRGSNRGLLKRLRERFAKPSGRLITGAWVRIPYPLQYMTLLTDIVVLDAYWDADMYELL